MGDYDFSTAVASRVASSDRVVHRHDVVPHLPFCFGKADCRKKPGDPYHYGTEVWYTSTIAAGANFTVCDGSGEDMECSNSLFPDFSALDHCNYFMTNTCGGCCTLL